MSKITLHHLRIGAWMLLNKLRKDIFGFYKYSGKADSICKKIVEDCFNGSYFQVSATGHYDDLWIRDLGWCSSHLIKLGYEKEVKKSIEFALKTFQQHNNITTTISKKHLPYNFPNIFPIDSLPYIIHILNNLKDKKLIKKYQHFLNKQIKVFYNTTIDPQTGLVLKKHFSQMRDHSIPESSCYANTMVALLKKELEKTSLDNPFKKFDYEKIIIKNFWNGSYFNDDLSNKKFLTSDANIYLIFHNIISDKKTIEKTLQTIRNKHLDVPIPLIYTKDKIKELSITAILVNNWEKKSVWTQLGMTYLHILKKHNKQEFIKQRLAWKNLIEKNHNVLENYNKNLKPYKSWIYTTDESMLWACMFLTL